MRKGEEGGGGDGVLQDLGSEETLLHMLDVLKKEEIKGMRRTKYREI